MQTIDDRIVHNLLTSLVISLIVSVEKQLPDHSKKARVLVKLEEALKEFGALNSMEFDDRLAAAGAVLWNNLLRNLQEYLEDYLVEDEQLELFQDY